MQKKSKVKTVSSKELIRLKQAKKSHNSLETLVIKNEYTEEYLHNLCIQFLSQFHLPDFSREHGITYSYLINFRNKKLTRGSSRLLCKILNIAGYKFEPVETFKLIKVNRKKIDKFKTH